MLTHFFVNALFFTSQTLSSEDKFQTLKQQLETEHFKVLVAPPPQPQAYGLFDPTSRTIWINPIVFELNIATPTLIHEATHAAQFCAGKGQLELLGLDIQPINQARRFFQHYHDTQRQDLEREAYAVQTQSDNFELVLSLLQKHCSTRKPSTINRGS